MTSRLLMIVIAALVFLFGDSLLTPALLMIWKIVWPPLMKAKALFSKQDILQTVVQSALLAGKALLRLINKTVTAWVLPLLMTRRQRVWLHHTLAKLRTSLRSVTSRYYLLWLGRPLWVKVLTLGPAALLGLAFFTASGLLLASLFGMSFIVPWIGGLPVATVVYFRRSFARFGLFILERLGIGPLVNKTVDKLIDLIWWRTPKPVKDRFDRWWGRVQIRMRRRIIGPRRQVIRRLKRFRSARRLRVVRRIDDVTMRQGSALADQKESGHAGLVGETSKDVLKQDRSA